MYCKRNVVSIWKKDVYNFADFTNAILPSFNQFTITIQVNFDAFIRLQKELSYIIGIIIFEIHYYNV